MASAPAKRLHAGVCFRGCRHSLMFRPPSLLATRVVPTVGEFFSPGPLWLLRPRISRFVTSPSSGYAHRPNRAIDGKGTCTLQDLRPCRPLLGNSNGILAPPLPERNPEKRPAIPQCSSLAAAARSEARRSAAWTCRSGWGRLKPQGALGARASGRPVGKAGGREGGGVMEFYDMLDQVLELLRSRGRIA